jgi:PIN domain nuclease of toxin-antitoxin system
MESTENQRVFSVASAWELIIKSMTGKLQLGMRPLVFLEASIQGLGLEILPVSLPHVFHVYSLPMHHRDPFDRLLVAQANVERVPIVTGDEFMHGYNVQIIW